MVARVGEPCLAHQAREHGADVVTQQPGARCGGEEAGSLRSGLSLVASTGVGGQCFHAAWVHRDLARLTVFTVADGEHPPVSYTHLRAHETVLDLVCRL